MHAEFKKTISGNGQGDLSKCVNTATSDIENIRESISPYFESISSQLEDVNKVDKECSKLSNRIALGVCVVQNVSYASHE